MSDTQTAEQALTHHVSLILDNDEPLYRQRLALVAQARQESQHRFQGREGVTRRLLADSLKEWCEEITAEETDDMPHNLSTEILTTALAFVDWDSLAADYLSEES